MAPSRLSSDSTALLVIDWQERLFPAMPESTRDDALARAGHLVWMAGELGMPVVATEQYPRGLGRTLAALPVAEPIEKLTFSAWDAEGYRERIAALGRRNMVVVGMETHICVALTCRDLVAAGYDVWLVADACLSRRKLDHDLGVERIRGDGARVVTAEAALFELADTAGTPLFKLLSARLR